MWTGPARVTALEAAQDYCDYINSGAVQPPRRLRGAGHTRPKRPRRDPHAARKRALRAEIRRLEREAAADAQGYVYLVSDGDAYKVGYSTDPHGRLASLQTGNPRRLRLLFYVPGTPEDEAALHAKYIGDNLLQEWFCPTPELRSEFESRSDVVSTA